MNITFGSDWRAFTRAECCVSVRDRGRYFVASSFEQAVAEGASGPRHMSVGRFRSADLIRGIDRDTLCFLPWTFLECETRDLYENVEATRRMLRALLSAGYDTGRMHLRYSGNKSLWIAIPAGMMGNPVGPVGDQQALRQRLFLPLADGVLDQGLWDARHLHRLPGSLHEKGGRALSLTFAALDGLFLPFAPKPPATEATCPILFEQAQMKTRFHVPAIEDVPRDLKGTGFMRETEDGVSEGGRNEVAYKRACVLLRKHGEALAFDELTEWNVKNDPPLSRRELEMCFRSAIRTVTRDAGRAA